MDFSIEKYVSNFIESQFPRFYQEEGPDFILFVKAYYEWLESSGNPIYQARRLQDYRNIDNTLEEFLEHFQQKYLYGIPFNIIANKRFLLKNILDVYRSKGTIQSYKLLFKLLYNQDVEVYLPGNDILRASDGTWREPQYLELTDNGDLNAFIGKTVIGVTSKTTAVVEDYIKEQFNADILNTVYISNVLPRGGDFVVGEKIVVLGQQSNVDAVTNAPYLMGSLDYLEIINGGQNFNIGDSIKIVSRDLTNNQILSYGIDGVVRVDSTSKGVNSLSFDLVSGGGGFLSNAATFVYKQPGTSGNGASFNINNLTSVQPLTYNTDLICDYMSLQIDATAYGFPGNTSGNSTSNTIGGMLTFTSNNFGTIGGLTNLKTGNGYAAPANVFVRSVQISNALTGSLSYSTSTSNVSGTSTIFDQIYANGDVIHLRANSSLTSQDEIQIIRQVVNSTLIVLYGPPTYSSTASAQYRAAPSIVPSQFAYYETSAKLIDGSLNGLNDNITTSVSAGNGIVGSTKLINSGKGYKDGEQVIAYLYSGVSNNISITSGGAGYIDGELLIFSGGSPTAQANGYINVNSNGVITNAVVTFNGSGYSTIPNVRVKTANGSGAVLTASLTQYNTSSEVTARVVKRGIGKAKGYWSTTRGFLNSDKYVQDSYYYQDYSYELRVASILDKYKNILYNTFHSSGSELFGKYLLIDSSSSNLDVLFTSYSNAAPTVYFTSDMTTIRSDSNTVTVDKYYI
jgi:hypothetical protein